MNAKPGVNFGNSSRLISAPFAKSRDVTLFWVGKVNSNIGSWGTLWGHFSNHDNDIQLRNTSGQSVINWHTNNDNSGCQLNYSNNNPVLYYGTLTAGTSRFFSMTALGNTQTVSATNPLTMTTGSAPIYIGASDGMEVSQAQVSEVLYYQSVLTPAQIATVTSYLSAKWGL